MNPLLEPNVSIGEHDPAAAPALDALLTHPVHEYDLRRLPGIRAALRALRQELEDARRIPSPLPDPALSDLGELAALLRAPP